MIYSVNLQSRNISSVGLEHYFDRVGVTGSNPVQSTDTAADNVAVFFCNGFNVSQIHYFLSLEPIIRLIQLKI